MNDITKLCDEMENCRKRSNCQFNEIVCVKKYLNEYIQDDYNNLLKLKTQADIYIENEKNELMEDVLLIEKAGDRVGDN